MLRGPYLELHLSPNPDLPKQYGKRIKACGGTYSHARGQSDIRFVKLPSNAIGRELANELITLFGQPSRWHRKGELGTPVILRNHGRLPDLIVYVHSVAAAYSKLRKQARDLWRSGQLPRQPNALQRAAAHRANVVRWLEEARASVAKYEAELTRIDGKSTQTPCFCLAQTELRSDA